LSSPCYFTCTVTAFGNSGTYTANVSVTDSVGNIVSGLGLGHTVNVTAAIQSNGGGFTSPAATNPVTLTISSAGPATSTATFTYKAGTRSWTIRSRRRLRVERSIPRMRQPRLTSKALGLSGRVSILRKRVA
jgi:hypothetical protein